MVEAGAAVTKTQQLEYQVASLAASLQYVRATENNLRQTVDDQKEELARLRTEVGGLREKCERYRGHREVLLDALVGVSTR